MCSSVITSLSQDFFRRDTVTVARELLGHHLVVQRFEEARPSDESPESFKPRRFRIVETEAYTQDDPACHAYQKREGRAKDLYGQPGFSYVYLIYGMYHCLNVVTEPEGTAGGVLFRAVEPLNEDLRGLKTHGPGRLTRALGITKREHHGLDLTQSHQPLVLAYGHPISDDEVVSTTRIGIREAKDYPWRFYIKGHPRVSVL